MDIVVHAFEILLIIAFIGGWIWFCIEFPVLAFILMILNLFSD